MNDARHSVWAAVVLDFGKWPRVFKIELFEYFLWHSYAMLTIQDNTAVRFPEQFL